MLISGRYKAEFSCNMYFSKEMYYRLFYISKDAQKQY